MTITRTASVLCIALAYADCEHEPPPRTARVASTSAPLPPEPGMRPASAESPAPTPTNALGVPATPPAAIQGPKAEPENPPQAETERTPDVVYVPTPQPVVDRMLQMAQVKKSDVVYDLGCGDGRIVITAAKRYGTRAYGFDIDPQRVSEAKANVKAAKVEDLVTIEQQDIFTLDLSPASVVTLYLLPKLNVRLIPQLEKLAPGSRIVSHDFGMEGVKPVQQASMRIPGEAENHAIYLWKTPLIKE